MKVNWRSLWKWALVVPAFLLSTFVAFIAVEFSVLLYSRMLSLASWRTINIPPSTIVDVIKLVDIFTSILLWILPPALAIGYALHARLKTSFQWSLSTASLLFALFLWVYHPSRQIRGLVLFCGILLIAER